MTADMLAPAWTHEAVTAEQHESWAGEQRAGIEIVDGMVVLCPPASKRHSWIATLIALTLNRAGRPEWKGGTDFDVRIRGASAQSPS